MDSGVVLTDAATVVLSRDEAITVRSPDKDFVACADSDVAAPLAAGVGHALQEGAVFASAASPLSSGNG